MCSSFKDAAAAATADRSRGVWAGQVVEMLVDHGAWCEVENREGRTPLDVARWCGRNESAAVLERLSELSEYAHAQGHRDFVLRPWQPERGEPAEGGADVHAGGGGAPCAARLGAEVWGGGGEEAHASPPQGDGRDAEPVVGSAEAAAEWERGAAARGDWE